MASRGTAVYGRLAKAKSAGNMSGGAELTLELTDIVINATGYPLLTSTYQVASQGQGNKTAVRIVGGTGLGAPLADSQAGKRRRNRRRCGRGSRNYPVRSHKGQADICAKRILARISTATTN